MKLVVAAPVADRDWALPHWYRYLAQQTVKPDQVLLIHGGQRGDDTWKAIRDCAQDWEIPTIRHHESTPPHDRQDNERFHTLTRLRNLMLAEATVCTDATHLLSLDTDIMLEDARTIERLLAAIATLPPGCDAENVDVVAPRLSFHPTATWTCNAGILGNERHHPREALEAGRPQDLGTWAWKRAEVDEATREAGGVQPIDIPMGAILMPRYVFSKVRYRWHQSGEDIGFGINLKLAGYTAGWLPGTYARHVWDRYAL
jgi:hypothetical protein